VGDDRDPEAIDSGAPQLRGEVVARRTAVDEHRRSASGLKEDRVPLADVEDGDPQARRRPNRPTARPDASQPDETERQDRNPNRNPPPTGRYVKAALTYRPVGGRGVAEGREATAAQGDWGRDPRGGEDDVRRGEAREPESHVNVSPARVPAPRRDLGDVGEQRGLDDVDRGDRETGDLSHDRRQHPQPHRRRHRRESEQIRDERRGRDRLEVEGDQGGGGHSRRDRHRHPVRDGATPASGADDGGDRPAHGRRQSEDAENRGEAELPADVGGDLRVDRERRGRGDNQSVEPRRAAPGESRQHAEPAHDTGAHDRRTGACQRHVDGDRPQNPDQARGERHPQRGEKRYREHGEQSDVLPRDGEEVTETGLPEVFDRALVDRLVLAEHEAPGECRLARRHTAAESRLRPAADLTRMRQRQSNHDANPGDREPRRSASRHRRTRAAAAPAATPSSPARCR